jgi:hypothetical protein
MPAIEILAYSPYDMEEFLAFCVDGKPDGSGGFQTDNQGRSIGGVLRWLHGREVKEAHFFTSPPAAKTQLLVTTLERPETYSVPWMKRIPGFEERIPVDGLVGTAESFASLENPLALVPNQRLNDAFAQGRDRVDSVLAQIEPPAERPPVGKSALLAALRGEIGSNRPGVFEEIRSTFGIAL